MLIPFRQNEIYLFSKIFSKISRCTYLEDDFSLISPTSSAPPQLLSTNSITITIVYVACCTKILVTLPSCTDTPKNRPRNQIASMDHGVLQRNMYLFVDFAYVGGTWNNVELLGDCNWNLLAPPGTRMETHAGHVISYQMTWLLS